MNAVYRFSGNSRLNEDVFYRYTANGKKSLYVDHLPGESGLKVTWRLTPEEIFELYKMANDNNTEWEFTKMRFKEAIEWVGIVQKQGLNVEIVN